VRARFHGVPPRWLLHREADSWGPIPASQAYSRSQEADTHREAIVILERAGQPPWMLRYALDFLTRLQGEGGGGWLSSHPARQDRLVEQPEFDDRVADMCGPDVEMDRQVATARTRMFSRSVTAR